MLCVRADIKFHMQIKPVTETSKTLDEVFFTQLIMPKVTETFLSANSAFFCARCSPPSTIKLKQQKKQAILSRSKGVILAALIM